MVARTLDVFGRLDVLVNNAGYGVFGQVLDLDEADLRQVFDVNFYGVWYGMMAAGPIMVRQGAGHIFNVSSVIGKRGTPLHGAYCATKFALCGLTESARVELRPGASGAPWSARPPRGRNSSPRAPWPVGQGGRSSGSSGRCPPGPSGRPSPQRPANAGPRWSSRPAANSLPSFPPWRPV